MVGMVSGTEGADAAVKFARKWGIKVKGISPRDVLVLGVSDNYHGVGSGIWPIMNDMGQSSGLFYPFVLLPVFESVLLYMYPSFSKPPCNSANFWPFLFLEDYGIANENLRNTNPATGKLLRYGHLEDFEEVLADVHGHVAAIIMECIHGKRP